MPSVSASSSPAIQLGYQQLKLQQAKRNAEQAEATAQALQQQAASAQVRAEQAQENARDLSARSEQAQSSAGQARQGLAALRSLSELSTRLEDTYTRIANPVTSESEVATVVPVSAPADAAGLGVPASSAGKSAASYASAGSSSAVTGTVIDTKV